MFRNRSDRVRHSKVSQQGFTLAEALISVAVTSMLSVGLLSFYAMNYKIGFVNQERNSINADLRSLTGQLMNDGRQSNYFVIYKSIEVADRNDAGDRISDGGTGDLLVFVDASESDSGFGGSEISRIVYYFRAIQSDDVDELAPVRRYEQSIPSGSDSALEALLVDSSVLLDAPEIVELSRGLANGDLFYNFWGKSVMLNGQIYHGNEAKRVTETYNFTVSPRG